MTTDLMMLAWTAAFTLLLWLPYILAHIANAGLLPALTYQADDKPLPAWATRAKKAHYNAVENLGDGGGGDCLFLGSRGALHRLCDRRSLWANHNLCLRLGRTALHLLADRHALTVWAPAD